IRWFDAGVGHRHVGRAVHVNARSRPTNFIARAVEARHARSALRDLLRAGRSRDRENQKSRRLSPVPHASTGSHQGSSSSIWGLESAPRSVKPKVERGWSRWHGCRSIFGAVLGDRGLVSFALDHMKAMKRSERASFAIATGLLAVSIGAIACSSDAT